MTAKSEALPAATLLLLIAAAFSPAFFAGFVWDDSVFLLDAKPVRAADGLLDIWFKPSSMVEGHYWPLVYTSFWLEHKLWGFTAAGFHATNVLLHCINTIILWRLLARLAAPGAFFVAAVFAVHPAHAEPVVWVISRKDLLGALFYLLAFACWLRFREQARTGASFFHSRAYLAMLALFIAGMLSKSFVVTLPAALLVWVWWRRGRIGAQDLAQTAPLFLLGLLIVIADLSFYFSRAVLPFDYSFAERLLIASKALWFYAGKLLWPWPLPIIYPKWELAPERLLSWLPLLSAAALALTLYLARHRIGRGPLAGVLFFAITLSPVLGFANNSYMGISFVADRYQYLASAGLLAALVAAAVAACRRFAVGATLLYGEKGGAIAARALAASLLAAYGALTFQQARVYRDPLVFFNHIRVFNPAEYHGHYNFGLALMERKRYREAEEPTRRAIEIAPDSGPAYQNLAVIMHNLNRNDETLAALKKATELADRQTAEQYYHIGHIAAEVGRYDEAESYLLRSLEMEPGHGEAKNKLVSVYLDAGRPADALALDPNLGAALKRVAATHFNEKRYDDALRYYRYAAAIEPDDVWTHVHRGMTLLQLQRLPEAQADFERVLELEPSHLQAMSQLAMLYFQTRRYPPALKLFQKIVAATPDNAEAHSNLGSALAQSGRLQEAILRFERALQLDPSLSSAGYNLKLAREKLDGEGARR